MKHKMVFWVQAPGGMALARMLTVSGNDVTVWSALEQEIDNLSTTRVHPNLPGMTIPAEMKFTKSVEEVCTDKEILLFAVPSVFVRSTAAKARPFVPDGQIIVDVAKGIEKDTLFTMTEILADELGKEGGPKGVRLVALSGPTHAEEVAIDLPTTIVSASKDMEAARFVQTVFTNNVMRVYTNEDIKGVELSGAMKNVIALGVGISTGLGYGDNARAALITRGIAEIARLGVAMGCNVHTFAGLAGIGDLIVTATSMHSRNNRAGILIGKGETPENAVKEVGMVVEGMNALPAALELAERYQVEMPIVQTVNAIVNKGMSAAEAVKSLMERGLKNELPQGYENNEKGRYHAFYLRTPPLWCGCSGPAAGWSARDAGTAPGALRHRLHGPDLMFYYKALQSNPVNRLGNTMHEQKGEVFSPVPAPWWKMQRIKMLLWLMCWALSATSRWTAPVHPFMSEAVCPGERCGATARSNGV